MLILSADQVQPCTLIIETVLMPGIEYRQQRFAYFREFPAPEYDKALDLCRQVLDQGALCILVTEEQRISLWVAKTNQNKITSTQKYDGAPLFPPKALPHQHLMYRGQRLR